MATCVYREGAGSTAEIQGAVERQRRTEESGGEETPQLEPCVWRRSRRLLTGRYAEREISMITQTERRAEEMEKQGK